MSSCLRCPVELVTELDLITGICAECWLDTDNRDVPAKETGGEMKLSEIKVGDRIKFRAATRDGNRAAVRVVTQIPDIESLSSLRHRFGVTYFGCRPFYLRNSEIIEHYPAKEKRGPFDGCRDDWQMPGPSGPRTKARAKAMRKPPFPDRNEWRKLAAKNIRAMSPEEAREWIEVYSKRPPSIYSEEVRALTGGLNSQSINVMVVFAVGKRMKGEHITVTKHF